MKKQDFLERVLRRFIPPPILYVCEAEESGWFAEIGQVAVIFVNIAIKGLPGMDVMQSVFLVSETAVAPAARRPYDSNSSVFENGCVSRLPVLLINLLYICEADE